MKIVQLAANTGNTQYVLAYSLSSTRFRPRFRLRLEVGRGLAGNAGDIAIYQSFRHLFETQFPGSKVSPTNCRKMFTRQDVAEINRADVLFVCGGGLFLYDTFPNPASDWQWGISEELLEEIKVPIVVYSVGFNKFRGQLDFNDRFKRTVTKLLEKSIFFGLRNTGSCNAIKRYVPERLHDRIKLNYCPTLLFAEAFDLPKDARDSTSVGFVMAGDRLKNRHTDLDQYITNMRAFVEYLKARHLKTILVDHAGDAWLGNYIAFDSQIRLGGTDSRQIYETYSGIHTVVGDRGHAQMIPFACGSRILTPISHDKLKWFLEDMGLQELGVEESDDDLGKKLIEKFNLLQSMDWPTVQQQKLSMIRETNMRNLSFIKEHLGQLIHTCS